MIQVCERFFLKDVLEDKATQVMQILDDLLGPGAHAHPGWCGHATFLQSVERPSEILMLYPWRSAELHVDLRAREDLLLEDFYERYCTAPRSVTFYRLMDVEVEYEHEGVQTVVK
jgi:3-oxoacyl-[acyl-carrier protein] reductase